ncbi:AraC family transcriptional regulator N-terminal domain-containing protein [Lentzea sp. NPDC059081]|uniref:AraC family transcriptional regulator n=1 Tax=Lentzea sp. NPDC059081 TaxID=3346719 RepID=UPI00368579D8
MSFLELRTLLQRHVRPDGATSIKGVRVCSTDRGEPARTGMSGTVLALVGQGRKQLALGDDLFRYGVGQYLVTSVDLPVTGQFCDGGGEGPALGFGMTLDPADIAEVLLRDEQAPTRPPMTQARPGIGVSDASAELLDAVVRLLRLLDRPRDLAVLAPLIKQEIIWLLLTGERGDAVRELGLSNSRLSHVRRAVQWIRQNYTRPFRVEDVAQAAGMSVSAFHRGFQEITAMTPIQYQKQLRLQEARLLLAQQPDDVTGVSLRVGYNNLSQFSREYRRQFGAPPSVDAARLRGHAFHEPVDALL